MPVDDILTPREAAYIATNAYFSLKNWINKAPVAGVESRANIQNRVLGSGTAGSNQPATGAANPTLRGTSLGRSSLISVHSAETGLGVVSGFGYTLSYRDSARSHAIVAMRGTRAEYGPADLVTDARGALTVIPSPTGSLFSTDNHDMTRYIKSVGNRDWNGVRLHAKQVNHDNCALATWLLRGENPGWLQVASAHTLGVLLKVFAHVLGRMSTSLILRLSALDFMAEVLVKGLYMAKDLADQVRTVIGYAATWAGLQVTRCAVHC